VWSRNCLPFRWTWVHPSQIFNGVRDAQSIVVCVVFCRSLFVLLSFSFGHWLFFDLRLLIAPLVSSNSSYIYSQHISNSIDETLHREQDHFMTSFLRYVLSITIFPFVPFLLSIISSVYLGFTASDCACPFGFFKLLFFYIHSFILYTNKRSPIPHNISFSFDVVVFYFELYMIVNNFVCWSLASINWIHRDRLC
jgi:hypothetical protein